MSKSFVDRFFSVRLSRDEKKVKIALITISILLFFLLMNTLYLTYQSVKQTIPISSGQSQRPTPTLMLLSVQATVEPVAPTATPTLPVVPMANNTAIKEIFIPFGSGTNQSSDWTNVSGLTAQIDFGKYPRIKEIHFEATVGIPTQNESASVQLFNVTDGHPVWYSPITLTDGQFVSSSPLSYDVGPKIYQVQMKTSLQFLANLYSARIHIILQ